MSPINAKQFLIILATLFPLITNAETAKRIIALSPHSVEMLYKIGAGKNIIATTEYADYPESAKNILRIGGYYGIQMEKVIALKPDLIVVWSGGNKKEDIEKLTKLGFHLYDSNPKTLSEVATNIEQLGKLTGKQKQSILVANQYRSELNKLTTRYKNKKKIKVFYQLWQKPLMTVSNNSWIAQIIATCNGENIFSNASSDYPQVSIENVLIKNPQVILISKQNSSPSSNNWNKWPEIDAVKNHHIYSLNADLLHRPTTRSILGIKSLCNALDNAR